MKKKTPRQKLIEKVDHAFSRFIRLGDSVDGYNTCFTCGVIKPITNMDAGHYMVRGRMSTRFDEQNVQPQCKPCNKWGHGEQAEFGITLDEKYGQGTAKSLIEKSHTKRKYTLPELEELLTYYKEKVKMEEE